MKKKKGARPKRFLTVSQKVKERNEAKREAREAALPKPPYRRVLVGDTVRRKDGMEKDEGGRMEPKWLTGTVVYIHPKGRYHVVDFGGYREAFCGVTDHG